MQILPSNWIVPSYIKRDPSSIRSKDNLFYYTFSPTKNNIATMSFFESCQDVVLVDGHILQASAQDEDGNWCESEIDLDELIGNMDGRFEWGDQSKFHHIPAITDD